MGGCANFVLPNIHLFYTDRHQGNYFDSISFFEAPGQFFGGVHASRKTWELMTIRKKYSVKLYAIRIFCWSKLGQQLGESTGKKAGTCAELVDPALSINIPTVMQNKKLMMASSWHTRKLGKEPRTHLESWKLNWLGEWWQEEYDDNDNASEWAKM